MTTATTPKRALITGITGQDGSYLCELLLGKGYEVHGIVRRMSGPDRMQWDFPDAEAAIFADRLHLHYGDLTDANSLINQVLEIEPDEVYNLAAQSHVQVSFEKPVYTADVDALGTMRLLEAVRLLHSKKSVRFFQACTSEMFGGNPQTAPQSETTPFHPRSPYGCAKVFAFHQTVNYREAYGLFACNGILFNHESPRRGETFVTRKITMAAARISEGLQDKLWLGNLDAQRDWGYARDYVEAIWLMLQQPQPDDYVIATGKSSSVREFLEMTFEYVGLKWQDFVHIDPKFIRPSEVYLLQGDATKAAQKLNWHPKTSVSQLARIMVDADLLLARAEKKQAAGKQT